MKSRLLTASATLTLFALITAGCGGSSRAQVSGTVTRQDGSPLVNARVIARSEEGKTANGATDTQGHYSLGVELPGDGVPPGKFSVAIVEQFADEDVATSPTIASKYSRPNTSGLSFEVAAGEIKTFDMTLEGAK